jgi:hypothetical protein
METVPRSATAKQLKHPNHSDSGGNTWQSNKFGYTDIYSLIMICELLYVDLVKINEKSIFFKMD